MNENSKTRFEAKLTTPNTCIIKSEMGTSLTSMYCRHILRRTGYTVLYWGHQLEDVLPSEDVQMICKDLW